MAATGMSESVLAARALIYAQLQVLLGTKPTADVLGLVDADLLVEAFAEVGIEDVQTFVAALQDAASALSSGDDALAGAYTRCFEGPGKLPAPLWESMYFSGDPALFQESTLRVRNAYRAAGFIPAQYPHVADDHVAIELDFMRALAQQACAAEAGSQECQAALVASKEFLDKHLGRWIDLFAQKLEEAPGHPFYAAVASTAARFVVRDRDVLLASLADD